MAYDTSAMSAGDSLQIYYDDVTADSYTETIKDLTVVLAQLSRTMARPTYVNGVTGAIRSLVESGSIAITS